MNGPFLIKRFLPVSYSNYFCNLQNKIGLSKNCSASCHIPRNSQNNASNCVQLINGSSLRPLIKCATSKAKRCGTNSAYKNDNPKCASQQILPLNCCRSRNDNSSLLYLQERCFTTTSTQLKQLTAFLRNVVKRCVKYPSVKKNEQLPRPPIPSLAETMRKYEGHVSVLARTAEQLTRTQALINGFLNNEGPILQQRLVEVAEKVPNWCSHYWLNDMYLDVRLCLPVNINPAYVFPRQAFRSQDDMLKYAALLVCGLNDFKEGIDRRKLSIDRSTGKAEGGKALCMEQYWRIFSSYRSPGVPRDIQYIQTHSELKSGSEHIIVMCNNQSYKVQTVANGERLALPEIKFQLEEVSKLAQKAKQTSDCVYPSLLTAADRNKGYAILDLLRQDAENERSLQAIQRSTFVLCLDKAVNQRAIESSNKSVCDKSAETSIKKSEGDLASVDRTVEDESLQLLHGCGTTWNAANRWFNKTNQFIVSEDGVCGMNFEHSVAEGIVLVKMVEHALAYVDQHKGERQIGDARLSLKPSLLRWNIPDEASKLLKEVAVDLDKLINDLNLTVVTYHGYGKNYAKSLNISPDCFIQLILQLTYFRCHGHLISTYESASVRRFRHGRVDNIRAAHPAALAWATKMQDCTASREERLNAFSEAIKQQQKIMLDTITGFGIDNHLVALREVSKEIGIPVPELFEDPMFKETFRFPLSTSQVPTKIPNTFFCYGPVVEDGYGCSYNPFENSILFAISSFKSCKKTDSQFYQSTLFKSLDFVKEFLGDWRFENS